MLAKNNLYNVHVCASVLVFCANKFFSPKWFISLLGVHWVEGSAGLAKLQLRSIQAMSLLQNLSHNSLLQYMYRIGRASCSGKTCLNITSIVVANVLYTY